MTSSLVMSCPSPRNVNFLSMASTETTESGLDSKLSLKLFFGWEDLSLKLRVSCGIESKFKN